MLTMLLTRLYSRKAAIWFLLDMSNEHIEIQWIQWLDTIQWRFISIQGSPMDTHCYRRSRHLSWRQLLDESVQLDKLMNCFFHLFKSAFKCYNWCGSRWSAGSLIWYSFSFLAFKSSFWLYTSKSPQCEEIVENLEKIQLRSTARSSTNKHCWSNSTKN